MLTMVMTQMFLSAAYLEPTRVRWDDCAVLGQEHQQH